MALDDLAPDVDFSKEMPEEAVAEAVVAEPVVAEPATVVVEQATPEVKPEPKQEPRESVPLKTYLEEKAERKALAARIAELEAQKSVKTEVEAPSFDDNPAAHLLHKQQGIEQSNKSLQERLEQYEQAQQQQTAYQSIASKIALSEQTFKAKTPDYDQAIEHMKSTADRTLQLMGMSDPLQRQQAIVQNVIQMSNIAIQQGQEPAEFAYNYSKALGYQTKAKANPVQQISQGLEASKSLGTGASENPLSLATIESLSDSDIDKLIDSPGEWEKLRGMMR